MDGATGAVSTNRVAAEEVSAAASVGVMMTRYSEPLSLSLMGPVVYWPEVAPDMLVQPPGKARRCHCRPADLDTATEKVALWPDTT